MNMRLRLPDWLRGRSERWAHLRSAPASQVTNGGKILIPAHAVRRFAREDHPDFVRSRPFKKQPASVGSPQEADDSTAAEENRRVAGL
jgi:hypothetical protein